MRRGWHITSIRDLFVQPTPSLTPPVFPPTRPCDRLASLLRSLFVYQCVPARPGTPPTGLCCRITALRRTAMHPPDALLRPVFLPHHFSAQRRKLGFLCPCQQSRVAFPLSALMLLHLPLLFAAALSLATPCSNQAFNPSLPPSLLALPATA